MKNRVVLLSLTIAGLFCWILMFVLNASSRDFGGISYLLSVSGAALVGTGVGSLIQLEQRPGAGAEQHRPGHTQQGGRAAGETGRTRRIQDEHRDAAEQPRDCQGHQYDLLLHVPSSS